jgi:hypothetical protein
MRKATLLALPMLLALFGVRAQAQAQTVTFTTSGGPCCQYEAYTVVSEDGAQASGTVQIATPYGYPQSGIVLPYNPTAPGEYLNPVINILSTTYTGNWGDPSRTVTFNFNSTENMYGYTWAGTFTSTLVCVRHYRGRCSGYGPGQGSGTMTATPVQ